MKRHWLRALLLGMSMALLLAGGAALAQDTVPTKADQDCLPCYDGQAEVPPEEYRMDLVFSGLETEAPLCQHGHLGSNSATCWALIYVMAPLTGSSCELSFWFDCEDGRLHVLENCEGFEPDAAPEVGSLVPDISGCFGQWRWWVWQSERCEGYPDTDPSFTFLFTDICEVEFVPEPASILLLGSGLAGLAGYAALRWRAKE
jgi:hypothetical protein